MEITEENNELVVKLYAGEVKRLVQEELPESATRWSSFHKGLSHLLANVPSPMYITRVKPADADNLTAEQLPENSQWENLRAAMNDAKKLLQDAPAAKPESE